MGVYYKKSHDGKKIWYIDYYVDGHRKREKVGESKTQAKAVLAKRKGEIVSGKFKLKDSIKTPSFDKYADDYLEWAKLNKKSWKRDQNSIDHLKKHFGARRLSEIHTWHVEKYKRERMREPGARGPHPSPATVNRELACLKKMYSLAIRWGKALENPAKPVELMKEQAAGRRLTPDEKQALLEACSAVLKPVVIFAMQTGRRLNEILKLQWRDVNMQSWHTTLRDTKSGDTQTVPVNSVVQELLRELPKNSEWVFVTGHGGRFRYIRRTWLSALAKSGIGHCRFHDLRHTWASEMGEHTDLKTLMELGGWKRPQIPMRYVHPATDHKRNCLEQLVEKSENVGMRARVIELAG